MITGEAVEAAARAMAILNDDDGCFLEVDAWNAQEDWERDACPDSYPGSAIEDCSYWTAKARAALEAAAPFIIAQTLRDVTKYLKPMPRPWDEVPGILRAKMQLRDEADRLLLAGTDVTVTMDSGEVYEGKLKSIKRLDPDA